MKRASRSLPTPLSPVIRTVESTCATRRARSSVRRIAGLEPTRPAGTVGPICRSPVSFVRGPPPPRPDCRVAPRALGGGFHRRAVDIVAGLSRLARGGLVDPRDDGRGTAVHEEVAHRVAEQEVAVERAEGPL